MDNGNNNFNGSGESSPLKFKLFVSGMSVNSSQAIENFRMICDKYLMRDTFELEIIDISREKELAVHYQLIGIPALIKVGPDKNKMVLGDLSDTEKVLKILDIDPNCGRENN